MSNAIAVIYPYKTRGLWMFDDPAVALREEPFVSGVGEIIDLMTAGIPDAINGFRMMFSANPFPGYDTVLEHIEKDRMTHYPATKTTPKEFIPAVMRGDWYVHPETGMEGWLCPALLKYFDNPPKRIFVKLEADPDVQAKVDERKANAPVYTPTRLTPSAGYWPFSKGPLDKDIPELEAALNESSDYAPPGWWSRSRGMRLED